MVNKTNNEMINKLISKLIQVDIDKKIKWEEYFNDMFFKKINEKEYDEYGKLKFEGEYLNGKIWIGKDFNLNNEIIFEIKFRNGKVKEYFNNDKLKFEGEYLNGKEMEKEKNMMKILN